MAKKFSADSLNAVDYAIDTITDAVSNPEPISSVAAHSEPQQTNEDETALPIENKMNAVESIGEESSEKPTTRKKKTKAPLESDKMQKPIGLNVFVPPSIYKRLMSMKADTRKPLNQIGLDAIIKYLDRNGY